MSTPRPSEKLPEQVHDDLAAWLDDLSGDGNMSTEGSQRAAEDRRGSDRLRPSGVQFAHPVDRTAKDFPDGNRLHLVRHLKTGADGATDLLENDAGNLFVRKFFPRHDESLRETYRTLIGLRNPHLPRVYSVTETAKGIETVRAYVPGATLRDWVGAHGPVDDKRARRLLAQVAEGVHALHGCKPPIIHRDINPNNIVMGPQGPQLIDFGIARPFDPGADRDTHTWGTHGYAAPEQFGFGQSDARTDVFALGMLYWFLLTGTDPDANLHARLSQMAPNDTLAQRVPAGAREIIGECVTIAPERRFANVDALITALQVPFDEGDGIGAKSGACAVNDVAGQNAGSLTGTGAASGAGAPVPEEPLTADTAGRGRPAPAGTEEGQQGSSADALRRGRLTALAGTAESDGFATHASRHSRLTVRKPKRTLPGKIWFFASSAGMGLLLIGAMAFTFAPWRFAYPEALARAIVACLGMFLFFGCTWLVTANPFGFRDRVAWFQQHPVRRCVLFAVGGVAVGTIIIYAICAGLSPEYVQIMTQNGSTSV